MHQKKNNILFITLFLSLMGVSGGVGAQTGKKITQEQYLTMMAQQKSQTYQNFLQNNQTPESPPVSLKDNDSFLETHTNATNTQSASSQNINPIGAVQNGGNRIINCWDEASKTYGVDPWLLFAYAKTESSFRPWVSNGNPSSSTVDRGIMQINSIWLPQLAKYNITTSHLFDSCVSIFVGAWIIRQNINRYGYNYNGLVAYNVGNPFNPRTQAVGREYYTKLNKNYEMLTRLYRKQ